MPGPWSYSRNSQSSGSASSLSESSAFAITSVVSTDITASSAMPRSVIRTVPNDTLRPDINIAEVTQTLTEDTECQDTINGGLLGCETRLLWGAGELASVGGPCRGEFAIPGPCNSQSSHRRQMSLRFGNSCCVCLQRTSPLVPHDSHNFNTAVYAHAAIQPR